MRINATALLLLASPALACSSAPICRVPPESLSLTRLIDFEGLSGHMGPGRLVDEILVFPGARIAERFAGQALLADGDYDAILGQAAAPLTLVNDPPGQTKSLVYVSGTTLLNGFGPAGFPRREAQGEGAIAVQFDNAQPALAFDIRGGEAGAARVQFLRADGSEISTLTLTNLGEGPLGFMRADGLSDIAGIVITNIDPQGIAFDNLRFGPPPEIG